MIFLCVRQYLNLASHRLNRNMFDEKRKLTSIVYLSTLCTSITVCFIPIPTGPKIGLLVIRKYTQKTIEGRTHQFWYHFFHHLMRLYSFHSFSMLKFSWCKCVPVFGTPCPTFRMDGPPRKECYVVLLPWKSSVIGTRC